ncbi:MAG TPA: type II toxin-antitoxin system PemK/MazF family toxin [Stellaceae bacterium]|jgi:mRNA interferase MazF|nr:type II toxin-antitoxin system PemK/MazF family toxin [Stellaceae bacterium]
MPTRRGDVVAVAAAGNYGKPRPAVIVQSDAFPEDYASVVVCQMTSVIRDDVDFRVTVEPSTVNGLRLRSQVMADKPIAIPRRRVGQSIGRLSISDMGRLDTALAFVMGLSG